MCVCGMLVAQLCLNLWIITHQASLSIEFSGQEYWITQPFPSPGDLPNPWIEPGTPVFQADSIIMYNYENRVISRIILS